VVIAMGQSYRRDAVGRIVVEDGLVRMEPYGGRGLHTQALKGATDALSHAQAHLGGLMSLGGDQLGAANKQLVQALANITAPRYTRDAVGRVVVEDGLARMQPYGSGLHTQALTSATEAVALAQAQLGSMWDQVGGATSASLQGVHTHLKSAFAGVTNAVLPRRWSTMPSVVTWASGVKKEPAGIHTQAFDGAKDAFSGASAHLK